MPLPSQHTATQNAAGKYKKIRRENDKFGKGIDVLWGVLADGKTEVQSIHFDADKFTAAEAKKWLKDNDYSTSDFEEAKGKSMNSCEYKNFAFKITSFEEKKKADDCIGYIKGYASTFGNIDRGDDVVERGAFVKTIDEFRRSGKVIPMCFQHSQMDIIGGFDPAKMYEDEKGLHVEGEIYTKIGRGADVYELAKHNVISDMSIGYGVVDQEFGNDTDNGRTIRKLKEVKLYEISMVATPMNPQARITDVKAEKDEDSVSLGELKGLIEKSSLDEKEIKYLLTKILRKNPLSKKAAQYIVAKLYNEEIKAEEDKMNEEHSNSDKNNVSKENIVEENSKDKPKNVQEESQEGINQEEVNKEQENSTDEKSLNQINEIKNILSEFNSKQKKYKEELEVKEALNKVYEILDLFKK